MSTHPLTEAEIRAFVDAWYLALAEVLEVPLITLDLRLVRAAGAACQIITP